jgi:hypothetical protein
MPIISHSARENRAFLRQKRAPDGPFGPGISTRPFGAFMASENQRATRKPLPLSSCGRKPAGTDAQGSAKKPLNVSENFTARLSVKLLISLTKKPANEETPKNVSENFTANFQTACRLNSWIPYEGTAKLLKNVSENFTTP